MNKYPDHQPPLVMPDCFASHLIVLVRLEQHMGMVCQRKIRLVAASGLWEPPHCASYRSARKWWLQGNKREPVFGWGPQQAPLLL